MPFLLHLNAAIQCPHSAKATLTTSNARVRVSGQPVAVAGDQAAIAGCPFQVPIGTGTKPQPCVTASWTTASLRVRVMGRPALLNTSVGMCKSAEQIPQGPPNVLQVQLRVKGL